MKSISFLFVTQFILTLAYINQHPNETMLVMNLPRMRHSRHLSGSPPILNGPFVSSSPPNGYNRLSVKDNHKPVFKSCSSYKPVVKEESPIGTYVFTILAVDIDPPEAGGTVTYKFVTTAGERERFIVQPESGQVWTNDIFDHDEPSREKEVYITLRATDNGHPSLDDACTIRIVIEDINDNPPVFDKVTYSESVPQDHQLYREVMRISATDIDDGKNSIVNYKLDPNTPDASYFYIDPSNGVIFLNKTIDKPPGFRFKLNAIVKDNGDPPQQNSITLNIQVVESNKKSPSFIRVPDGPIRLKENHHDFTNAITSVTATSNIPGEEDKVQFELVVGQTEQTNKIHSFVLEPFGDIAYIKIGALLDYERINEYSLTVRIQNNYRLAAETIITVLVEDVNDNIPTFSEIRGGTVLENEPVGTQVMQVKAIDYDGTAPHNVVTYELSDPTEPFAIDPINGNITTLKMFDREDKSFYNIKVLAIDGSESANVDTGAHNIGVQTFLVEIADRNDNPPNFTQDTYVAESIAENANINELVTQVTALDVDTASIVTYSIVSGNTYDSFTIRNFTGEIRVNRELDYENMTSFSLDVRAFDGIYEDYAKVIIKIENLNDNPPIFVSNYTKTIQEERLYEGCIVKVEAYDPDIRDRSAPQNIVYSLVKHEQKDFLEIDNDGCLRLTKPLDRDQPTGFARWQILIMAADHGGKLGSDSLRSTTEVILELTDINDNAPFLTNTQPVVWMENTAGGQIVALTAKDYDSPENGAPFKFALNDSAAIFFVKTLFEIRGTDLYATGPFDREEQKEYLVPILITDSGTPPMTGQSILRVVIGDRNDNPMRPGSSNIFVYNYKGEAPDMEVGRVYVLDPDDWDVIDKKFTWLPSFEEKSPHFDVNSRTGMITMRQGTPNGTYLLRFNVTEESEPLIGFHWVEATVNVTVKSIIEEAVDKSGSIRFINTTAEEFIIPEADGTSKKDKLHVRLSKLFNESLDNVDIFTVSNKQTVKENFLDVRFSAHGSPFFSPEKMETMISGVQEQLEKELNISIYMIHIDECLIENEQCDESCHNVLIKSNAPNAVFTNTTSFIGVTAQVEPECTCEVESQLVCFNGGTPFADKCECPDGFGGPRCEQTSIGFHGDGWAMYSAPQACNEGTLSLTVTSHTSNALIFYMGPLKKNPLLPVEDFMSLELIEGFPVLMVNYGTGTTRINNSVIHVADGKPHFIEILLMKTSFEMFVDRCKLSTCMSLAAPTGNNQFLNINGPLQLGGSSVSLKALAAEFGWRHVPTDQPFVGCISNLTFNKQLYNLGEPSYHMNADPSCQRSMFTAVTFGINTNFLVAILVCSAILIVVVHRRRQDTWAEKELDDIRENIIAYEDEGGGEGDAGYDLHVLRKMYEPHPDAENWQSSGFIRVLPNSNNTILVMRNPPPKYVSGKSSALMIIGSGRYRYFDFRPRIVMRRSLNPIAPPIATGWILSEPTRPPPRPFLIPILDVVDDMFCRFGEYVHYRWAKLYNNNSRTYFGETIELEEIHQQGRAPRRATSSMSANPEAGSSTNDAIDENYSSYGFPSPCDRMDFEIQVVVHISAEAENSNETANATFAQEIAVAVSNAANVVDIGDPMKPRTTMCGRLNPPQDEGIKPSTLPRVVHFAEPETADSNDESPPALDNRRFHTFRHPNEYYLDPEYFARTLFYAEYPYSAREYYRHKTGIHRHIVPDRQMDPQPSTSELREDEDEFLELVGAAPDISGFLDDKKEVMDRDPDALNPFDDVRYYAYEGDGNSSGSLSSLASCTDDGDLKFNYLSTFGPRFRKLADLYHDAEEERHDRRDLSPQEESWC